MPSDRVPEPWRSLLAAIDERSTRQIEIHCLGGFAVSLHYGLMRPTGDIDVCRAIPSDAAPWLVRVAGAGTDLHRRHRVHLQISTVATVRKTMRGASSKCFPAGSKD